MKHQAAISNDTLGLDEIELTQSYLILWENKRYIRN